MLILNHECPEVASGLPIEDLHLVLTFIRKSKDTSEPIGPSASYSLLIFGDIYLLPDSL